MKKKIKFLIVAAHPDDEILGCGATAAKLISNGHEGHLVIVSEGFTARDVERNTVKRFQEINYLKNACIMSNKVIGIKKINFLGYPDNRLDQIPFLEIVKKLEKIIKNLKPTIVFTHNYGDLNIDHRLVNQATITATRPIIGSSVKKVLAFEVLSSSEWNFSEKDKFVPNYFVDINKYLTKKLKALNFYKSEMRKWPHPRSLKGVINLSEHRGAQVGLNKAEAFMILRDID